MRGKTIRQYVCENMWGNMIHIIKYSSLYLKMGKTN